MIARASQSLGVPPLEDVMTDEAKITSTQNLSTSAARPAVSVKGPLSGQGDVCELVLRALPQWFGMETGVLNYIHKAGELPSFVAHSGGNPVGIALIERHFERSAELSLIGVLPARHRMGVGRALLATIEPWLREQGVRFLQVKTLSARSADANYARTRAFYVGMGFVPLEEFPTLWNEQNPCLILVKSI
jgi:GNAT superfamily N-acetyltransferase